MLTPETTNANAEAQQMPGGRIKNWAKKNDQFLLGATTTGIGAAVGTAVFAALTRPPPNGIDPDIAAHVKENSVTIIIKAYDADGNVLTFTAPLTGEKTEIYGHGSGIFLGETEGRLIGTAAHVVQKPKLPEGAEELRYFVVPNGGKLAGQELEFKPPTTDTAVDTTNDVAIVDLGRTTGYTGVEFAPPGSAELGETVYGIGTPLHPIHAGTLKKFTISSLDGHRVNNANKGEGHVLEEQATEDLLQLDGILHGGNSGGIIFDTDGRFLGVMTHRDLVFLDGEVNESTIGFATRAEKVKELMERYMASPEYLKNVSQTSVTPSSHASGAEELAAATAIQNGIEAESADATLNGLDAELAGLSPHLPQSAADYSAFAAEPVVRNAMCSPIHGCAPLPYADVEITDAEITDANGDAIWTTILELLGS